MRFYIFHFKILVNKVTSSLVFIVLYSSFPAMRMNFQSPKRFIYLLTPLVLGLPLSPQYHSSITVKIYSISMVISFLHLSKLLLFLMLRCKKLLLLSGICCSLKWERTLILNIKLKYFHKHASY